jgi:hypothetical protein
MAPERQNNQPLFFEHIPLAGALEIVGGTGITMSNLRNLLRTRGKAQFSRPLARAPLRSVA